MTNHELASAVITTYDEIKQCQTCLTYYIITLVKIKQCQTLVITTGQTPITVTNQWLTTTLIHHY